jgi:hypothetical protein
MSPRPRQAVKWYLGARNLRETCTRLTHATKGQWPIALERKRIMSRQGVHPNRTFHFDKADRGVDLNAIRLTQAALATWADAARGRRWTFFIRLSFAWAVSEYAAAQHVERWVVRLRRLLPGAAVMVGLHTDQGRIHAHALVFIPRRGASRNNPYGDWLPGCATTWHQTLWPHGLIWLDRFASDRTAHAAEYSFREVGTVMQIGTAPPSQPLR